MKVLQGITAYLPATQNWIYHLLRSTPGAAHYIAPVLLLKQAFSGAEFHFPNYGRGHFAVAAGGKPGWRRLVFSSMIGLMRPYHRRYLVKMARAAGTDLLHAHFAQNGWRYRKVAGDLNIPLIISFYGYDYEYIPHVRPIWRERYRVLFREAQLFLCEGRFGARVLAQAGCPEHKIRVLPLGVHVGEVPIHRRRKQPESLHLLQVASLTEKKGQEYAVLAFIEALKRCPNMTLTLVGRSHGWLGRDRAPVKTRLERLIRAAGVEDKVIVRDEVPFDELYEIMARYHVFIHPSCYSRRRDCEGGAPVVLLDAQATGMPVIATTHCDIPDVVVDGRTGMLTPERDVPALAASIEAFYRMGDDEYQAFSHRARAHVEDHYDIAGSGRELARLYRECRFLQGSGGA
jgi:colanic acid/amylovoran biosynthesis glycosyltransferase